MTTIIGVRFKSNGKMYYFDPQGLEIAPGTGVIVETARGVEYGDCVQGNTDVPKVILLYLRILSIKSTQRTHSKNRKWIIVIFHKSFALMRKLTGNSSL